MQIKILNQLINQKKQKKNKNRN